MSLHLPGGETIASFATLTFLEVILGVDNIVFLALAVARLAPKDRRVGRAAGLALAMALRILMLGALVWITNLDVTVFWAFGRRLTLKGLVLIGGGLFLLVKGTTEIHDSLDPERRAEQPPARAAPLWPVVLQIGLINIVFSLDSVITAVGMTNELGVMAAAVVASTLVMLVAAAPVGTFIEQRPTMKMLAFAFILLVGVALIADGAGFHLPRGYVYFAIAFSVFVEVLNAAYRRVRGRSEAPHPKAPPGSRGGDELSHD